MACDAGGGGKLHRQTRERSGAEGGDERSGEMNAARACEAGASEGGKKEQTAGKRVLNGVATVARERCVARMNRSKEAVRNV